MNYADVQFTTADLAEAMDWIVREDPVTLELWLENPKTGKTCGHVQLQTVLAAVADELSFNEGEST